LDASNAPLLRRQSDVLRRLLSAPTIGQKADENMSFDSTIILVINGADIEVVFEFLEDLFDFGENDVLFPEIFGLSALRLVRSK